MMNNINKAMKGLLSHIKNREISREVDMLIGGATIVAVLLFVFKDFISKHLLPEITLFVSFGKKYAGVHEDISNFLKSNSKEGIEKGYVKEIEELKALNETFKSQILKKE